MGVESDLASADFADRPVVRSDGRQDACALPDAAARMRGVMPPLVSYQESKY